MTVNIIHSLRFWFCKRLDQ